MKKTNNKVLIIIIISILMLLFPTLGLSANKSQQFQYIVLPPKVTGSSASSTWVEVAYQKSIEFTLKTVSLYGFIDNNIIDRKYREVYIHTNPYILNNGKLAEFGKLFHGDYVIAGEISYSDSSNYFEINIKIVEVVSGKTVLTNIDEDSEVNNDNTISVTGNAFELISIGDKVFDEMVNYHKYEPTHLEKSIKNNLDFKVNPYSTKEWCLGFIQYRNSHYDQAKDHFIKARVNVPDFSEALRMIARINTVQGSYELAQRTFKDAINANIQNYRTWNDLALYYSSIKAYNQAESSFSKAIQLRTMDVEIYANIGDLNYRLGNYGLAKDWYLKAMEIYDLDVQVLEGLIRIQAYKSKNWDDAFKYAENLLSIDDRNYTAYSVLANYFATKEDYYNAINMAIEALLVKQTLGGTYLVGMLYMEYYKQTNNIKHFDEAVRALEYCIDNDYNVPDIYVTMAKAYALVFNGDKSAYYLELAFENGFTDIDSILFDTDFENVKDNPKFKEVISKWYAILNGDND